jgi:hypothetical protein
MYPSHVNVTLIETGLSRACQESGAIDPAPINARKMIRGAWSIAPVKKRSLRSHFIHFQLQILQPYAFKFHQM